jgi:CRP-like cAMP-binding protein
MTSDDEWRAESFCAPTKVSLFFTIDMFQASEAQKYPTDSMEDILAQTLQIRLWVSLRENPRKQRVRRLDRRQIISLVGGMPVGACEFMERLAEATPGVAEVGLIARVSGMGPVAHRLSQLSHLSQSELGTLQKLEKRREYDSDALIAGAGLSTYVPPRFLLSGWACRQRVMPDGRRQIFGFLIPGDVVGASSASVTSAFASIVALTPVMIADVPLNEDKHLGCGSASIYSKLMAAAEHETEKLLYDHIVRLGRMNGLERMAHLLLELRRRLSRVGLVNGQSFPMPLRQESLGDALGMSTVHVNRTMQQLRLKKLIQCSGREVTVLDPVRLTALADGIADWAFLRVLVSHNCIAILMKFSRESQSRDKQKVSLTINHFYNQIAPRNIANCVPGAIS